MEPYWKKAILPAAALTALMALPAAGQILAPTRAATIEQPAGLKPITSVPLATGAIAVKSVEPVSVQIDAGGAAVNIVLKGSGLDKITRAEIFKGTTVARDIEAKPGTPAPSERQVALKAAATAVPGTYQLRVGDGTKKIDIPLSTAKIEVKAKSVAVSLKPPVAVVSSPLIPKTAVLPKEPLPAVPPIAAKVEPPTMPVVVLPQPEKWTTIAGPKVTDIATPQKPVIIPKKKPAAVLPQPEKWTTIAGPKVTDIGTLKRPAVPALKGEVKTEIWTTQARGKLTEVAPKLPSRAALPKALIPPTEKLPDAGEKITPQAVVSKLPADAKTRGPLSSAAGPLTSSPRVVALQKGLVPEPQPSVSGFEPQTVTVPPCGLKTVKVAGMLLNKITAARIVLRTSAGVGVQAPALSALLKPPPDDPHLALYVDISADCSAAPSRAISPSYYVLELSAGTSRVGEDLRITVPGESPPKPVVAPLPAQALPASPLMVPMPSAAPRASGKVFPDPAEKKGASRETPPQPTIVKVEPGSVELDVCTSASVRVTGLNLNRVTSASVVAVGEGDARQSPAAEGFAASIHRPANDGDVLYARLSLDCGIKSSRDAGGASLVKKKYGLEFYADEGRVGERVPVSLRHETRVAKADPAPLQLSPCDTGIVHITGSNLADITDVRPVKLNFPEELLTTLSPGNEARDLRVQVSCRARAGALGNYLLQLYTGDTPVMDLSVAVTTPPCPDGRFNALGRFRDCSCPAGFKAGIDSEGMAQCMPDSAGGYCPVGDWFCTGDGPKCERPDCSCPPGYRAESKAGGYKICVAGRCPEEKWFSASGQWRGCSCPEDKGQNKRYRKLNAEAICTVADIDNETAPDSPDEKAADPLYRLYQGFFSLAGAGAALMPLPPDVQNALRPYFRAGTVELAQYGSSRYVLDGAALTDCMTIFFPAGQGAADDIAGGRVLSSANLPVLLHALAHVEQCISSNRGDRAAYARGWFGRLPDSMLADLDEAVRRLDLGRVSAKDLHARMPMETGADARAAEAAARLSRP